ncbi:unnamed protein product, partial [Iphiclides podalirius]
MCGSFMLVALHCHSPRSREHLQCSDWIRFESKTSGEGRGLTVRGLTTDDAALMAESSSTVACSYYNLYNNTTFSTESNINCLKVIHYYAEVEQHYERCGISQVDTADRKMFALRSPPWPQVAPAKLLSELGVAPMPPGHFCDYSSQAPC